MTYLEFIDKHATGLAAMVVIAVFAVTNAWMAYCERPR